MAKLPKFFPSEKNKFDVIKFFVFIFWFIFFKVSDYRIETFHYRFVQDPRISIISLLNFLDTKTFQKV